MDKLTARAILGQCQPVDLVALIKADVFSCRGNKFLLKSKLGRYSGENDVLVPVRILDIDLSNKEPLKVTPMGGHGAQWVNSERVYDVPDKRSIGRLLKGQREADAIEKHEDEIRKLFIRATFAGLKANLSTLIRRMEKPEQRLAVQEIDAAGVDVAIAKDLTVKASNRAALERVIIIVVSAIYGMDLSQTDMGFRRW